ncbi:hypothetical protein MO973_07985 [Paenibacillus sp. TRM 82003]|nr:hypothetical protein [Paenibacillus sp. TRM 82003]
MKKIAIGGTAAILIVYLGFVLVSQVFPYVKWIVQSGDVAVLEFESAEEMKASSEVAEPVKAWLALPGPETEELPAPASFDYRDDGFTTPQIEIAYDRGSNRYVTYRIGGNYDLPTHTKLKSVDLAGGIEGDLLVGRDNTVVIKWRDLGGPPYRYLYFYDPAATEADMTRLAAAFSAATL